MHVCARRLTFDGNATPDDKPAVRVRTAPVIRTVLLLLALAAAPLCAQETGGGGAAYVIGGIPVDTAARTTYDARLAAYAIARRKAWPMLWNRLTGQAETTAPRLGDGALQAMVAGIEVEGERFSTTRYIARLGVVFDRARASAYFDGTAGALQSGPMLLLPIFSDGGARTLYQTKTPWIAAWARFSEGLSPIDYVLASGSAGDNVLLTAYQTQRSDRSLWRNILNRFGSIDVLIAEVRLVRSFPGGPVAAEFIARHGPDATELGRLSLRSTADGLDAMLDDGVRRIDAIYAQVLREGRLVSEPDLTAELEPIISLAPDIGGSVFAGGASLEADVATPDGKAFAEIEALLRTVPTVGGVTLTSVSLGGVSRVAIRHTDTIEMLRYQLDQKGLRLATTATGTLLRRRIAGDVPVPAPVVISAEPGLALPGSAGTTPVPPAVPTEAPPVAAPPATVPVPPVIVPPGRAPPPRDQRERPALAPDRRERPASAPDRPGPVDLLDGLDPR